MPDSIVQYFREELESWTQILALYERTITGLERRLYAVLQRDSVPALAQQTEELLGQLLLLRADIAIMSNGIEQQGQHLKKDNSPIEDSLVTEGIIDNQEAIRNQMKATGQDFADQTRECEAFLSSLPE